MEKKTEYKKQVFEVTSRILNEEISRLYALKYSFNSFHKFHLEPAHCHCTFNVISFKISTMEKSLGIW